MPTLGTHLSDEMADTVETVAPLSPQKKVGPWIAEAIRMRLEREGKLPANPVAEIVAAAEEIGFGRALELLTNAETPTRRSRKSRKAARQLKEAA